MKNNFRSYLTCSMFIALAACNSGGGSSSSGDSEGKKAESAPVNQGVDERGNCSFETTSAFNDIANKSSTYNLTRNIEYLKGTKNACDRFYELIGDKSCKAKSLISEEETTISKSTVKRTCDDAERLLSELTK